MRWLSEQSPSADELIGLVAERKGVFQTPQDVEFI